MFVRRQNWVSSIVGLCLFAGLCAPARVANAYTPDSPEVKQMIAKAMQYLRANAKEGATLWESLGAKCLVGMVANKTTGNAQDPFVLEAVQACREAVKGKEFNDPHINYGLGIALIFLADLDPELYRPEAEKLIEIIYKRQQSYGAWTYDSFQTGDVSQTQFPVLGLWIAYRSGIQVRLEATEAVCNWLIRIQNPDGGFPYQGEDPGSFNRKPQKIIRDTMGVAGTASLYVCAEVLGFITPKGASGFENLPPAIHIVEVKKSGNVLSDKVDGSLLFKAIEDGNRWLAQHASVESKTEIGTARNQAYYLYGVERYNSFREYASGNIEKEPTWYNAGVDYLKRTQASNGSWNSQPQNAPVADTALSTLFLLRSSKAILYRLVIEKGRLSGGKGLSADMSNAKLDAKGKVVAIDPTKSVGDLLAMLEDPEAPDSSFSEVPEVTLSDDPVERGRQLARLRRMIINGPYKARLAAAQTLGTIRDLESAPALIYALSDPDCRIVRAARDSLRFMSRKLDGFRFDVPSNPKNEPPPKHEVQKAQADWTKWLLSAKPDAELIN